MTELKVCKKCGIKFDDDYSYDLCLGCHAKEINCEIRVVE